LAILLSYEQSTPGSTRGFGQDYHPVYFLQVNIAAIVLNIIGKLFVPLIPCPPMWHNNDQSEFGNA
jgi:hypothetical protein